ncbi:MAG: UDP-N-acetylmuramoyl-L-alanine--D-glutamate ligase [Clostridiales bacterium]|nr:UDP-N-acetylmuramoyl-L-alanine--D-glutamate ligase [Clostridiales bacterium]
MTHEGNLLLRSAQHGGAAVIGIGISNIPLIRFLLKHKIRVTARDRKEWDNLPDAAKSLADHGVNFICGENYLRNLKEGVIFRSPGVKPWLPEIKAAVDGGARLTSETELFFALTLAKLIGVTGSDGKTTTTTLIYKMLSLENEKRKKGNVYVGGNIGTPLIQFADDMTEDDIAVLELSSFQLQTATRSPHTAVITNISPNHLDWHHDLEQYIDAKRNIYQHRGCHRAIINADCPLTAPIIDSCPVKVTSFSSGGNIKGDVSVFEKNGHIILRDEEGEHPIIPISSIKIPGKHNIENYMAAIAAVYPWVGNETIREVAETFNGVEHRIEYVRTHNGVKYYNSSIDSTPTRTEAALRTLGHGLVVICGGRDKKIPFDTLAKALCVHARAIILTGEAGDKIKTALLACEDYRPGHPVIVHDGNFEGAVNAARQIAKPGEIVLLSPACTSFDAFANFEQRGNRFKAIVNAFN